MLELELKSLGLASRSSWYMSYDVMLYKYGKHRRIFWDISILFYFSFLYFGGVLNKTIIPSALVGCEIVYSPIYIYGPCCSGNPPSHTQRALAL